MFVFVLFLFFFVVFVLLLSSFVCFGVVVVLLRIGSPEQVMFDHFAKFQVNNINSARIILPYSSVGGAPDC